MTDKSRFEELTDKLREIFQIDQEDLDFGIYRIMNMRNKEIDAFLKKELSGKVQSVLAQSSEKERELIQSELNQAIAVAKNLGVDPESASKVKELKDKLAAVSSDPLAESEVYSHLLTFFSRYYDNGDFVSKRRYNGDKYAIPYAGEEVKLYWANADQYYVKTGENFSNFDFMLDKDKKVHFKLLSADTTKDNVKDNNAVRGFVLYDPANAPAVDENEDAPGEGLPDSFLEVKEFSVKEKDSGKEKTVRELFIYFQYVKMGKSDQKKFLAEAEAKLTPELQKLEEFQGLLVVDKEKKRTLLGKYLTQYTGKNKSDYFIHKSLESFLTGELDFYIKNEMMHLDDILKNESPKFIEMNLRKIKAVREIALELIKFMAQIEEFQKKLWLKKKFVIQCDYCITLDRLPDDLKQQAFQNEAQIAEWKELGLWNGQTAENAGTPSAAPAEGLPLYNNALMVDTKFFDEKFKSKLLEHISKQKSGDEQLGIDSQCDGIIIHSENFQALNLLQERYKEKVDSIYIDPPYNTEKDREEGKFIYKDNFEESSWLSMICDRLILGNHLSQNKGNIFVSISNDEQHMLKILLNNIYGVQNFIETFLWVRTNTPPSLAKKSRKTTEYIHCFEKNKNELKYQDVLQDNGDAPLLNAGNTRREILFPAGIIHFSIPDKIYPAGEYKKVTLSDDLIVKGGVNENPVRMIGEWKWQPSTLSEEIAAGTYFLIKSMDFSVRFQRVSAEKYKAPNNHLVLDKSEKIGTNETANTELKNLQLKSFDYTKPSSLVSKLISFNNANIILDYFAGSGTTGHAVIDLNRKDGGHRKYILVEMGDHFNTVLKPRLEKVVYSPDWKAGKPEAADKGISHCFKYMTLESYEDALNNIERKDAMATLPGSVQEEFLLKYMLELESRGSLINTDSFKKPFDYKLKIAVDSAGAMQEQNVDLIETFNYLIGLTVTGIERHIDDGYVFVTGKLPGEIMESLIVWRNCDKISNAKLNELLEKKGINAGDSEYATIFVNGDHSIRNFRIGGDEETVSFKVRQIENEFLSRMFEVK